MKRPRIFDFTPAPFPGSQFHAAGKTTAWLHSPERWKFRPHRDERRVRSTAVVPRPVAQFSRQGRPPGYEKRPIRRRTQGREILPLETAPASEFTPVHPGAPARSGAAAQRAGYPAPQRLAVPPGQPKSKMACGSILIATLWVIIALTGLVITLSVRMRADALAQANRAAAMRAAAAERGAEQFLLAVVDQKMQNLASGQLDLTSEISMQAVPLGSCYIWVIQPTYNDGQSTDADQTYSFGLTDELGKLNLNTATANMLQWLPGVTPQMAASIIVWRGGVDPTGLGAGNGYYETLPDPYRAKQAPFESVDELYLVQGFTPFVLYGYNTDHTGVLNSSELQAMQTGANTGSLGLALSRTPASPRGLFPFVTALPADVGGGSSTGSPSIAKVNPVNEAQVRRVLTSQLGAGRANQILSRIVTFRGPTRFANVFAFYYASGLTPAEFTKVYPHLTAGGSLKVNIMTAPPEVLACLPGLRNNPNLVSTILTQRQAQLQSTTDPTNLAWLVTLPELRASLTNALGDYITGESTIYSADIVAVTSHARAYDRCRILIQAGNGSSTNSRIIYRQDVTSDGWPLPAAIRQALRAGQPPPITATTPAFPGMMSPGQEGSL